MSWILTVLINAGLLFLFARLLPKVKLNGYGAALVTALVIGLLAWAVEPILQWLATPITWLTLGLFRWVVSAFVIKIADWLLKGFTVQGFLPAVLLALLLAAANYLLDMAF